MTGNGTTTGLVWRRIRQSPAGGWSPWWIADPAADPSWAEDAHEAFEGPASLDDLVEHAELVWEAYAGGGAPPDSPGDRAAFTAWLGTPNAEQVADALAARWPEEEEGPWWPRADDDEDDV